MNLEGILISVCSLLSEPNSDSPLNSEAAQIYRRNRMEHDRIAQQWARMYAGAPPEPQLVLTLSVRLVDCGTVMISGLSAAGNEIASVEVQTSERMSSRLAWANRLLEMFCDKMGRTSLASLSLVMQDGTLVGAAERENEAINILAEKRVDPLLGGSAVTFDEMVRASAANQGSQKQAYWKMVEASLAYWKTLEVSQCTIRELIEVVSATDLRRTDMNGGCASGS